MKSSKTVMNLPDENSQDQNEKLMIFTKLSGISYILRFLMFFIYSIDYILHFYAFFSFNDDQEAAYQYLTLTALVIQIIVSILSSLCGCIQDSQVRELEELGQKSQVIYEVFQFLGLEPFVIFLFNIFSCRPGILLDFRLSDSRGGLRRQYIFQSIPMLFICVQYLISIVAQSNDQRFVMDGQTGIQVRQHNQDVPTFIYLIIAFSSVNCIFGWLFFSRLKEAINEFKQLFKRIFMVKKFYLLMGEIIGRPFFLGLSAIVVPQDTMYLNFTIVWLTLETAAIFGFSIILIILFTYLHGFQKAVKMTKNIIIGCAIVHPWVDSKTWQRLETQQIYQEMGLEFFRTMTLVPSCFRIIQYITFIVVLQLKTSFPDASSEFPDRHLMNFILIFNLLYFIGLIILLFTVICQEEKVQISQGSQTGGLVQVQPWLETLRNTKTLQNNQNPILKDDDSEENLKEQKSPEKSSPRSPTLNQKSTYSQVPQLELSTVKS